MIIWQNDVSIYTNPKFNLASFRGKELKYFECTSKKRKISAKFVTFSAAVSIKPLTTLEGIIGFCRTIFICFVLAIGSVVFSSDANTLVLNPIERMLEKVKFIAKNPLAAASDEVESAGVMSMLHAKKNKGK